MRRYLVIGPDGLDRVEEAIAKEKRARERHRLETIRLGMLGQYTMAEVAERSRISRATLGNWTKRFQEGGIAGLLASQYSQRGRKPRIGQEVLGELRAGLEAGRFKRAKEVRRWLAENHAIKMGLKGVYYWLGKLGGVLKVPRKTHARKDAAAAEAFKSELFERLLSLKIEKGSAVRIWVADEHRYGLMSVVRKVWTLRGHQPKVPHQSKYQWGYLHAALEVGGAHSFECFFSSTVGLDLSSCFLEQLAESDPHAEHIVIWDGAGFHPKAGKHPIPDRIHLVELPAYSPELNPAEKLFDQLKDSVGNQIYDTIEQIEEAILHCLEEFWLNSTKIASLIGKGWMLDQTNASTKS